jgi:uncharacterized protein YndB with AHSA1/START domain
MVRKILLLLVAAATAFAGYVAMQPPQMAVARSITIDAPPAKVFPHLNDFRKWQEWSPWAKVDPNATATFEGPASGKDAVFKWSGNSEVGEGQMRITEAKPDENVNIALAFSEPFQDTADVSFGLKAEGGKTNVTWSITNEQGFLERALCVIFNGRGMIEREYDKGLANLKKVVEAGG